MSKGPKVLLLDIETLPLTSYVWSIWNQDIPLNMIAKDFSILAFCAKWLESSDKKTVYGPTRDIIYMDVRHQRNINDDKAILKKLWKLLDECDILVTQNGVSFDSKKINARLVQQGFTPPSPYKQIDTKKIASKHFAFTSNKLEYLADKLKTRHKKLTKRKYAGFALWQGCMNKEMEAFAEMEAYNRLDVLSLEDVYHKLQAWDCTIDFNVHMQGHGQVCNCGSTRLQRRGVAFTKTAKYQRYQCQDCGSWMRGSENLIHKDFRKKLKRMGTR